MTNDTEAREVALIVGGTSDIGHATALAFACNGYVVKVAGRDLERLRRNADDVALRAGSPVSVHYLDILDTTAFPEFVASFSRLPDVVVCVVGVLGEQNRSERNLEEAISVIRVNYEGPALLLGEFANRLCVRGSGTLIGVSSVAGDRGRASNYVYGSAKAGFSSYLSGLRGRLAKSGVHVMTVKPGFVNTRMTEGMSLPKALTVEPRAVGEAIVRGIQRRADVIYVSKIWWIIMNVINMIPEPIFKRLRL